MRKTLTLALSICFTLCIVAGAPAIAQTSTDNVCLYGFSKSWCDISVRGGDWGVFDCPDCPDRQVLKAFGGLFDGQLTNGTGTCTTLYGGSKSCDDADDLFGTFRADVDLNALRGFACPGRGSWGGTWTLFNSTQVPPLRAQGRIDATMGVGTHRLSDCSTDCGPNCEECYNASFDEQAVLWTIHSEGFLEGDVLGGEYAGCRIRATFSGDLRINNGDQLGPLQPNPEWFNSCFNIDGVLECPCSTGFGSAGPQPADPDPTSTDG